MRAEISHCPIALSLSLALARLDISLSFALCPSEVRVIELRAMAAGSGVFQVDPAFRIVNRQHCGFYVWRVEVPCMLSCLVINSH